MIDIPANLAHVRQRIALAAIKAGRSPAETSLLAVSKQQSLTAIRQVLDAGQRDFGENYLQEALPKIQSLGGENIVWHFIGPLQSNKTRAIAEHFSWVHSVDRAKIAQRLSRQRPENLGSLNVCLQVNIDEEDTKSGIPVAQALPLAQLVNTLPNIRLRGLMAIPRRRQDNSDAFQKMSALFRQMGASGEFVCWDTLSLGMSADLESAIAAGSTLVRVGTDIFGRRKNSG